MMGRRFMLSMLLLFLCTGCTAMLDRSYQSVVDHVDSPASQEDSTIRKAESYQELVNQIYYLVSTGAETGTIRLMNYVRDVEEDLKNACLEVANEDPLGAYAVDFIKHDYTKVMKYYEATVSITYRRSQEQVKGMVNVTGSSAIREELQETLSQFAPEAVLRVSYFTEDTAYLESLVYQAYYETPMAALGIPEITITLYPSESKATQRIVEILLSYPNDPEVLRRRSQELLLRADALAVPMMGLEGAMAVEEIYTLLRQRVAYVPEASPALSTAHSALLENQTDSEGLALAFQLLAQCIGLESTVIRGELEGAPHFWNVVKLAGSEWRHVDTTLEEGLLLTDREQSEGGRTWILEEYPTCGEPIVPASE